MVALKFSLPLLKTVIRIITSISTINLT